MAGEEALELEVGDDAARAIIHDGAVTFGNNYVKPNLPSGTRLIRTRTNRRDVTYEIGVDQQMPDATVVGSLPDTRWLTFMGRHFQFSPRGASVIQEGTPPGEPETMIPAPPESTTNGTNGTNGTAPPPPPPTVQPPPATVYPPSTPVPTGPTAPQPGETVTEAGAPWGPIGVGLAALALILAATQDRGRRA